jgi:hypothetical protein
MDVKTIKNEINFSETEYPHIINDLKNQLINKINTLDGFLPILQDLVLKEENKKKAELEKAIIAQRKEEERLRKIEEETKKKNKIDDEELDRVLKEAFSLI